MNITEEIGLELYDINYVQGSQTLKVYIEDPETQTAVIDDCMKMDRALSPSIEEFDWIPEALVLEVSSPGMFRELNQVSHFKAVLEEQIMLQTSLKLENFTQEEISKKVAGTKKFTGILLKAEDDYIVVSLEDKKKITELNINYKDIKKANLEPSID